MSLMAWRTRTSSKGFLSMRMVNGFQPPDFASSSVRSALPLMTSVCVGSTSSI